MEHIWLPLSELPDGAQFQIEEVDGIPWPVLVKLHKSMAMSTDTIPGKYIIMPSESPVRVQCN